MNWSLNDLELSYLRVLLQKAKWYTDQRKEFLPNFLCAAAIAVKVTNGTEKSRSWN